MASLDDFSIEDLVYKVIGEIEPVGSTEIDDVRLGNLEQFAELTFRMTQKLYSLAMKNCGSYEYSVKQSGDFAKGFILSLEDFIEDIKRMEG